MSADDATVLALERHLAGEAWRPRPSVMVATVPHEVTERMVQAFCDRVTPGSWASMTEPQRQICRDNFQEVLDAVLEVAA